VFEQLARASQPYTPEHVAHLTQIDEAAVRQAAELVMHSKRIAYYSWSGIGQHDNATQTERAIAVLYALTGSFDLKGGNRLYRKPPFNPVSNYFDMLEPAQRAKTLGLAERPLGPPVNGWVTGRDVYRAILQHFPYPVRAFFSFGANPLVSQADTEMGVRAFETLEFHVHCDLFETPTSRYADIFLPVNTPWEREGLRIGFEISGEADSLVQLRQRMVPPRGEARSDNEIVFDLAARLGMSDRFFGGSLEAGWNYMLAPLELTVAELRGRPEGVVRSQPQAERQYAKSDGAGVRGFATETRRVELYSELLMRHGYDPLPRFDEPADSPNDQQATQQGRYPYVLATAKNGYFCHSQHRSIVSLRKRSPLPTVVISKALAMKKGIGEGDWVLVMTRNAKARFSARINASLQPGLVMAEYGWWQACFELGLPGYPAHGNHTSNFNSLISADHVDPISGSVPHRSFLCDIALDPSVEPRQRPWPEWRPFLVGALRHETEDVLVITFVPTDGQPLPDHQPGQHISLRVKANESLVRNYSLIDAARVEGRPCYSIAVRRQRGADSTGCPADGLMSGYLHDVLRIGDEVELRAPSGNFVLPEYSPQPVVLVAGGIGITPFLSYLESLRGIEPMPEVWLHFANRCGSTHAFRKGLEELVEALPRLHVLNYYDAPLSSDIVGRTFDKAGFFTVDAISEELVARRARFYLCGPQAMMHAVSNGLLARGVPEFDIFTEVFRSPPTLVPDLNQQFHIDFARSGRLLTEWTPDKGTILDFGERLGVALPSGCRVGQCESCAVSIVSGQVQHLNGTEPDDPDVCLTCQAVPITDIVLDA
jgi:ferredoxin-NADP reductase